MATDLAAQGAPVDLAGHGEPVGAPKGVDLSGAGTALDLSSAGTPVQQEPEEAGPYGPEHYAGLREKMREHPAPNATAVPIQGMKEAFGEEPVYWEPNDERLRPEDRRDSPSYLEEGVGGGGAHGQGVGGGNASAIEPGEETSDRGEATPLWRFVTQLGRDYHMTTDLANRAFMAAVQGGSYAAGQLLSGWGMPQDQVNAFVRDANLFPQALIPEVPHVISRATARRAGREFNRPLDETDAMADRLRRNAPGMTDVEESPLVGGPQKALPPPRGGEEPPAGGAPPGPGTPPSEPPAGPPAERSVIGLTFPNAPPRRAEVVQYFDQGKAVRLRFDDGSTRDYLTSQVMRGRTEPPPPSDDVPAPQGGGKPLGEAESFDIMHEAEMAAPRPTRPASTATLAPDLLQKIAQAEAMERRAESDTRLTPEKRQDLYAAAQALRRQVGASREPTEFTDEELARNTRQPPGQPILGQSVSPISRDPTEFSDEDLARSAAQRNAIEARRAVEKIGLPTTGPTPRPMDLADFLAGHGGIKDEGGELRGMDADKWHREKPFRKKLVNDDGLTYDHARELAQEAGYLPPDDPNAPPESGTADMLDALRETISGRPVFSARDEDSVHQWQVSQEEAHRKSMAAAGHETEEEGVHEAAMDEQAERAALQAEHGPGTDLTADEWEKELDAWLRSGHPEVVARMGEKGVDVGQEAPAEPNAPRGVAGGDRAAAIAGQPEGAPAPAGRGDVDHPNAAQGKAAGTQEVAASRETPPANLGTAQRPVEAKTTADVAAAERHVQTGPTAAEKESGNYPKGHLTVHGMGFTIETPKGGTRRGVDADGKPWQVVSPATYGYFKKTEGADGDHVDGYIGPNPQSDKVFVIDQRDAGTGKFDEHKVMAGYDTGTQALDDYYRGFSDGLGGERMGGVHETTVDGFKDWLKDGNTKKPFSLWEPKAEEQPKPKNEAVRQPPTETAPPPAAGPTWRTAAVNVRKGTGTEKGRFIATIAEGPQSGVVGTGNTPEQATREARKNGQQNAEMNAPKAAPSADPREQWTSGLTTVGRRQVAEEAGLAPKEVERVSKMGWIAIERDPEIHQKLKNAFWNRANFEKLRAEEPDLTWEAYEARRAAGKKFAMGMLGGEPQAPAITQQDGWVYIGSNHLRQPLYEDFNGVRSVEVNGVRRVEPVGMVPTREGVRKSVMAPADKEPEFQIADPLPSSGRAVEYRMPEREPPLSEIKSQAALDEANAKIGKLPSHRLADLVAWSLDQRPLTVRALQDLAEQVFGGTMASGKFGRDDLYDALELGVNRFIQQHAFTLNPVGNMAHAEKAVALLEALKKNIPTQSVRAGEKETFQQFSTPPDYSFAVAWVAKIGHGDHVLEPSAGTGSIAVHAMNAKPASVTVNELSAKRADLVQHLGPTRLFRENAEQLHNVLPEDVRPTVVVMNPPFSQTAGRMGDKKVIDTGAVHVEQALKRLEPGGRLVAIVGGGGGSSFRRGMGMAPDAPHFRDWWKRIGSQYSVRANIGVDGGVYAKYGTTFDTRLLVIDKVPPTGMPVVTGDVKTIPELLRRLEGVRNDRPEGSAVQPRPAESSGQAVAAGRAGAGQSAPDLFAAASERGVRAGAAAAGPGRGAAGRPRAGGGADAEPGAGPVSEVAAQQSERPSLGGAEPNTLVPAGDSADVAGGRASADGDVLGPRDSLEHPGGEPSELVRVDEAAANPEAGGEISEAVYEPYRPQRVSIAGAKPHPGELVQSAAMASVRPPASTYVPKIPATLIKSAALSDAQLEAVIYAGHAHSQMLPAGEGETAMRRGFFIGDGTGVGKGREVAGIMLDNWNQGRQKAIWVTEKKPLLQDARRDWKGLGRDPADIFDIGKTKSGGALTAKKGIAFVTYDTLKGAEKIGREADVKDEATGKVTKGKAIKGKSRIDQLADWLGKDFDGVIAFDESHNMGNATQTKAKRGIKEAAQKALAGIDLQQRLPNARIVYVSATGATEVSNLAYAERLGLWGRDTAFPNREAFIHDIADGGIAAMELVARDMKSMGHYIARSLSYNGVEYNRLEHVLSPEQRQIYDKLAEAWQVTLNHINKALELIGAKGEGGNNPRAVSAAMSAFWSSHQRFFNQIITAMQMPTVLRSIEQDLREGRQAVLQLVNTNEASLGRALAKVETAEELEDLDMTPRDQLMQMVEHSFPVAQHEQYVDENGIERSRPVLDAAGNIVENREAVALREALLDQLGSIRVPEGPLEMLMNHFGTGKVAEVTGRKQRVVRKTDAKGETKTVVEPRSGSANVVEADAFQNGKKPILVFSQAGGTGRSYHADNKAPSAKARRAHYLVQAGWRADAAIQGFGRTHRTNQASAPIFHLVTTDLKGQKRFISSIARRLAQLGALTKGERRTGDQGLFSARDNLESREASEGLYNFFRDLHRGAIPDITMADFERQTGLKLTDEESGGLRRDLPDIPQFLNRLLSLKFDMQNHVFDAFEERLGHAVDRAAAAGMLDTGVETIKADKVEKTGDNPIYTHPESGAETRYVQLRLKHRNHPSSFEDVAAGKIRTAGQVPLFHAVSPRGRTYAVSKAAAVTDQHGNIIDQYRVSGPLDYRYVDAHAVDHPRDSGQGKWRKVENPAEAKTLWDAQVAKIPEFTDENLHLITGAVLPIWDRLQGSPKIYRLQTDKGERLLGRVIPPDHVEGTLKALGAENLAVKDTPEQVVGRLLAGGRATLSNGWTIKSSLVAGEPRLEIMGPSFTHNAELQGDGVFQERISYTTRYFIPTGDEGPKVLARVTARRPITELQGGRGGRLAEEGARYGDRPFFSALTRAIESVNQPKAPAHQWLGIIKGLSAKGVKEEEIAWSGVRDWLQQQKGPVTKEAVLDHLRQNEVQVKEVVRGGTVPEVAIDKIRDWLAKEFGTPDANAEVDENVLQDAAGGDAEAIGSLEGIGVPADLLQPIYDSIGQGATKHGQHTLPGGENYREMLLTMPARELTDDDFTVGKEPGGWQLYLRGKPYGVLQATRDDAVSGMRIAKKDTRVSGTFHSGHFDEPNVLAHVRMNDRTGPNGERILHIEEIQSDWHQKGRKEGYAGSAEQKAKLKKALEIAAENANATLRKNDFLGFDTLGQARRAVLEHPDWAGRWDVHGQDRATIDEYRRSHEAYNRVSSGVPDAPFKTSWHEMALKRVIRYAAENGYDKVTWTTGAQQADRYDLSKQVKHIAWEKNDDGTYNIDGPRPDGSPGIYKEDLAPKDLADLVGKEMAEKIEGGEGRPDETRPLRDWHLIEGDNLKLGGHGMAGFYDKMLPAAANKIAKPFKVKVGTTEIGKGIRAVEQFADEMGWSPEEAEEFNALAGGTQEQDNRIVGEESVKVHSLDITPEMRESVLKGQSLFQSGKHTAADYRDIGAELVQHLERVGGDQTPLAANTHAADFLVERGSRTGHESLVAYDHGAGRFLSAGTIGSTNEVYLGQKLLEQIRAGGGQVILHHNHPSNLALSLADLLVLAHPGVHSVIAHGHDGSMSAARITGQMRKAEPSPARLEDTIEKLAYAASDAIEAALKLAIKYQKLDPAVARALHNDVVARALDRAGIIDYVDTRDLSAISGPTYVLALRRAMNAVARKAKEINLPLIQEKKGGLLLDRASGPLRPDRAGGLAHVLGWPGEPSGQGQSVNPTVDSLGSPADRAPREGTGLAEEGPRYEEQPYVPPPEMGHNGGDPLDDVAEQHAEALKGAPPGTYERALNQMSPDPRASLPTRELGRFQQYVTMPRTLAAMDWRSARYLEQWRRRDTRAGELVHRWSTASQGYYELSQGQRDALNAAKEIDRLDGQVRPDDGYDIVVRNDGHAEAELSRPGQLITLDEATTRAYHAETALMRDAWDHIMHGTSVKLGGDGITDPDVLRRKADGMVEKSAARRLKNIADLMEAMAEQRRAGYSPLMRFGDYYIAVKHREGTEPDSMGGFPTVARFELVDSQTPFESLFGRSSEEGEMPETALDTARKVANAPALLKHMVTVRSRVAALRNRYPEAEYTIEHGFLHRKADELKRLDIPAIEKMFMALSQKDSALFGPMVEKLREQMYEEMKAGFKKRAKVVPGYSGDFDRSRGAYLGWVANHVADLEHGEAIRNAQEMYVDRHPDKRVQRYWKNWTEYQQSTQEEMAKLRQFGFYWTLAGNPSSTLLIAAHGPMVGLATASLGIGAHVAGAHLLPAYRETLGAMRFDAKTGAHIDLERLGRTPEEKALIQSAIAGGQLHAAGAQDVRGFAQGDIEALRAYARDWKQVLDILSSNITVADQLNRAGMLLGTYRMARDPARMEKILAAWQGNQVLQQMLRSEGKSPETVAKFLVDEGLFVWGKRNRMPVARGGLGTMLFQFRNFEVNYLSALWKFMTRMGRPGRIAGLLMLGGLAVLGGIQGLPFADDAEKAMGSAYHLITGQDPRLKDKLNELIEDVGFSKKGAEMMMKGPARAIFGVDLSSRMGFGNVATKNLSPTEALGVVPSMIWGSSQRAWNRYHHGQPLGALAELLPSALRNPVKGLIVHPREGIQTQYGKMAVPPAEIGAPEMAAQSMGFTSAKAARAYERMQRDRELSQSSRDQSSQLTSRVVALEERIATATRAGAGHSAEVQQLVKELQQVLAENPAVRASQPAIHNELFQHMAPEAAAVRAAPKTARPAIQNSPLVPP